MDYVTISGYDKNINLDDKPRFLTKDEITYITAHMPLAPSSDTDAAYMNREHIMRWLADQIRDIKLCPSAIPDYIQEMTQQHYKSLIAPGTPVGIGAAEAIGATSTQMTLNSVAPFEQIVFRDSTGEAHRWCIGNWIDGLLQANPEKIQFIPENRTQYLPLLEPVTIATPHANGKVTWEQVTAVTKHLPVGDLVKITTRSGRKVTATQSKSLLVWDGVSLVQREGSSVEINDRVPVLYKEFFCPEIKDEGSYEKHNDILLDEIVNIKLVSGIEYVYDLTVPVTTNFCLANGLGIADTFHSSGSAKSVSAGNDAMTDIIFARRNPKNESCTIYFTNMQMSYEEVLNTRSYIVGSMISDFIIDYDIDDIRNLPRFWWHNTAEILLNKQVDPDVTKVLRLSLNLPEMYKHRVTISQIAKILENQVPSGIIAVYGPLADGIIDLYCRLKVIMKILEDVKIVNVPSKLLEITFLQTIVMPDLSKIRVKGIPNIKRLFPIISPVWRVVMIERKVEERDLTDANVAQIFQPYQGLGYVLMFNQGMMKMTGISSRNVAALCQLAGLTVLGSPSPRPGETNHDRLYIAMPNDRFSTPDGTAAIEVNNIKYKRLSPDIIVHTLDGIYRIVDSDKIKQDAEGWIETILDDVTERAADDDVQQVNSVIMRRVKEYIVQNNIIYERITNPAIIVTELNPSDYINHRVQSDKRERNKAISERIKQVALEEQTVLEPQRRALLRRSINIVKTPLMVAAEFVFAETEGANLKELLALPGIDKRRTTCNNMYIIAETFGIEAARTFIIRALTNVISNSGSYVHPANITFIAEFITSRGKPYGATYTGISRQPGGHLSLATLERAGKVFTQNAIHGRKEDIRGVSASIVVGARMAIGTGYSDVGQKIIENGQERIIINDDLFLAHEHDDNQKAAMLQAAVPEGDLTDAVNLLKTMTAGGNLFDNFGDEKETNLLTLFGPGEVIPDINRRRERDEVQVPNMIRRVQNPTINVPNELVDILTLIKTGIPDNGFTDGGAIMPLTAAPVVPEAPVVPDAPLQQIISTGLVTLNDLLAPMFNTFTGIFGDVDDAEVLSPIASLGPTKVVGLPEVNVFELPTLDDFDLQRDLYEMRREQVRNLEVVDVDAFRNAAGNTS